MVNLKMINLKEKQYIIIIMVINIMEYKNYKREGKGIYYYNNREYKNDKKEGKGIIYKNGTKNKIVIGKMVK